MKKLRYLLISVLTCAMMIPAMSVQVFADSEKYLVLGKDLTNSEKKKVLDYLGVDDINDYQVSYVTNSEEHQYLGKYLSSSVIGKRALSSVVMESAEKDAGISVTTKNISYCSESMYQNALITAGVKDVKLTVAGPFSISGTAALVAATKSYEIMTGKQLDEVKVKAANNEIAVTQELGKETNQKDAAEMVASLKQKVAEMGDDYTREDGQKALKELEKEMNVSLSSSTEDKILDLMDNLKNADLDVDTIKTQAKDLYENIKDYANKLTEDGGFLSQLGQKIKGFIKKIVDFFK